MANDNFFEGHKMDGKNSGQNSDCSMIFPVMAKDIRCFLVDRQVKAGGDLRYKVWF